MAFKETSTATERERHKTKGSSRTMAVQVRFISFYISSRALQNNNVKKQVLLIFGNVNDGER